MKPLNPQTPATEQALEPAAQAASNGSVVAVLRALRLLEAFGMTDAQLTLAELSRRTGMHKTTVLRMARTLAADALPGTQRRRQLAAGPRGWLAGGVLPGHF